MITAAPHHVYQTRYAQSVGFGLIALAISVSLYFQDRQSADATYNAKIAACEHVQAIRVTALSVIAQASKQARTPTAVAHYAMLSRRYAPVSCASLVAAP